MKLLNALKYTDPCGNVWEAPKGYVVDGASIPQAAWSLIGGPFEGKYRDASVIHDVACDQKTRPYKAVHEAFYFAMLAAGVDVLKAKLMFEAVYYRGPSWPDNRGLSGVLGAPIDGKVESGSSTGISAKVQVCLRSPKNKSRNYNSESGKGKALLTLFQ